MLWTRKYLVLVGSLLFKSTVLYKNQLDGSISLVPRNLALCNSESDSEEIQCNINTRYLKSLEWALQTLNIKHSNKWTIYLMSRHLLSQLSCICPHQVHNLTQTVTQLSTNQAKNCFTSVIRQKLVKLH